ncbi:MAG TPA: hypothetical protein VJA22_01615, partial [Patescibacteria group bacterium]|nr:hypothetical protein [Patescibacteria group bacterium]
MNEWDEVVKAEDQSVSLFLKGLKAFWHLIAPRRKELITAVIILTVVRLMELVFPYLMKIVFDELNTLRGTEQL